MRFCRCVECQSHIQLTTRERKYLHKETPFLCSVGCLLSAIESFPSVGKLKSSQKRPYRRYSDLVVGGSDPTRWSHYFQRRFHSVYEIEVAHLFDLNGIDFEYEEYYFPINGTIYLPDYFVREKRLFIEVKGLWQSGQRQKMTFFREYYPKVNFLLIPYTLRSKIQRYIRDRGRTKL